MDALRYQAKYLNPTDLFSDKVLEEWALDQGFKLCNTYS